MSKGVRDGGKVSSVCDDPIEAVRAVVSPTIRALIDLQLLTAARAGELLVMRPIDLDTTGKLWVYTPHEYKTKHLGHDRTIYIGKRGQAIITQFLTDKAVNDYVFSPAEADAERRAVLHAKRKTPLSCGNRPGTNRKTNPKLKPGNR